MKLRVLNLKGLKIESTGDMGRSLSDVVVEMYGFPRDMALDIQESIASRRLVSEAFKNDSMFDDFDRKGKVFDLMDYLDHQLLSENWEQEDAETLNWKSLRIVKENFEDLYMEICNEDEKGSKSDMEINSGSGYCDESILRALKNWMFHLESVFCDLVYNL